MANAEARDHWSSEAYSSAASFVPALATAVVHQLDLQPDDYVIDIGCGDGVLTRNLAAKCKHVVGLDFSASMIRAAKEAVTSKHSNATFLEQDCRRLKAGSSDILQKETCDKVFSNAAMHWILRDTSTRITFFTDVFALLKPGGAFVFEMGGAGNVAEVHAALTAVLHLRYGVSMEKIKAANPWFFPSENWMRKALQDAGFQIKHIELEYRPTKATPKLPDGTGGLEGWLRLMGANFLELLDSSSERDEAVAQICALLDPVITREEDGSQWFGYVRLRAAARKP